MSNNTRDIMYCFFCGMEMEVYLRQEIYGQKRKITWLWHCECGKQYKQVRKYNKIGLVKSDGIQSY